MIQKRQRRRRDGSTYSVFRVRWYERDGRERSRTFDTMGDARAFEGRIRVLKRAESLDTLDAGRETLADFTAEWWEIYATPNLERATLKGYSSLWNVHLLPRLGHLRLRDFTVRTVAGFRRDLEAAGVGRETVRKALALLQGILQRAVEWERLGANPARAVRKPPLKRDRAVVPLSPQTVEALRARLLNAGRVRDATLVSVLAYAGLRPGEALALQWRHVRERTLLVEHALTGDGEFKGQKTRRPPRTVDLLAPLRRDLATWKLRQGRPGPSALVFANAVGDPWKEHDWRNWRRRAYDPAAHAVGLERPRPYDLRHSFASLLIHEGRHSIVDIAQQLGHNANTCLSTYAHVIAELRDGPRRSAEAQIREAREGASLPLLETDPHRPNPAGEPNPEQLTFEIPLPIAELTAGLEPGEALVYQSSSRLAAGGRRRPAPLMVDGLLRS